MRVLIAEDFLPIRKSVAQGLREAGYAVDEAGDGETALWHARSNAHDVVILDLMLPKRDGFAVLSEMRRLGCEANVLILTARNEAEDRVRGLEAGADDYLAKPFHFAELLARVRALIRRRYGRRGASIRVADLEIDLTGRTVKRSDSVVDLSAREYGVLEYLALNAGRTVSRSDIFNRVYDAETIQESNVIDVTVARLRSKLEGPGRPRLIFTRRGFGYVLAEPSAEDDG